MKKFFLFNIIFWSAIHLFAQIEPVQSNDRELKALKVNRVSTYYFSSLDTANHDGQLILKKEFDDLGKITKKYVLSLWEAVSYSNTTTFSYDNNDQLIETTTIQTILNLNERDDEYITAYGDTPLHETMRFVYNSDGQLVKKEMFTFSTTELPKNAIPSQTILYGYEDYRLVLEESTSPNKGIFNQTYTVDYVYNEKGILSKKTMQYGAELKNKRITEYWYNESDQLAEEKITDSGVPRNNGHFKYEYDQNGLVKNKWIFDALTADFVVDFSYTYDSKGNMTSGERDVVFEYNENGLILTELWRDAISDQVFYFVTNYTYQ